MESDLCTTREAAQRLGVSLRTVQLWVESGVLRAWKTAGGHRRIQVTSVDEILKQRRAALGGAQAPADAAPPFTLVVVEDDPDLLKLYRLQVSSWKLPLRLVTAINGFEGLVRIGETQPQLLISDLNMPGMDGFRMIRSLRASADYKDMEIVAVTALGQAEIADRGGLPEDVKVMTKPVPFSELERLVRAKLAA
ncbi:response regulator [Thiobacillus denitrificans]|uniref:Excisionase n=1 Tax=Thiobacillus denitrificans TaxID=36861 RepID=A0A106BW92_THIDE|nr:response regulator [Thiobacillus denitrificans]KVW99771.1 excisionase [Thiobacillus denitrificans]